MRTRIVLAAFLLGVSLCFVPVLGYGEVRVLLPEQKQKDLLMEVEFLKAQVSYLMKNTTAPFDIEFWYFRVTDDDIGKPIAVIFPSQPPLPDGTYPANVVYIWIRDTSSRAFYNRSGPELLDQFKRGLEVAYSYINDLATDMDNDIVAQFLSQERIPLGYFYQGEYHLWPE